jgi:hypothetical protein
VILGFFALLLAWWQWPGNPSLPPDAGKIQAVNAAPQLTCIFYKFTIQRPTLEFGFNVEGKLDEPRFEQHYVATSNGEERIVDVKDTPYPVWQFDPSSEPKRLQSEIRVLDTSLAGHHTEPVTIELYSYNPKTISPEWFEAGIKSVHYQNLPGQCRQAIPLNAPVDARAD